MKKKLNSISVEHGVGKKIAKAFGCTTAYVSQALKGHTASERARKIRHVATAQYGGIEMVPVKKEVIAN